MSKQTAVHHTKAAEHHEHAAKHHREAAKYHEAGNTETAAFGVRLIAPVRIIASTFREYGP
jgi:hypothetical protein